MQNQLAKIKIGILGGGQLARMLALKCHDMGIRPFVLSARPQDPAGQVTPYFVQGKLNSLKDLKKILSRVDLAIFENEFLDSRLLHTASISANTPIHPKPKVMNLLQDRLHQKKLLRKHKIPTARFIDLSDRDGGVSALEGLFPEGAVLKKRHQGYDGYGIFMLHPHSKTHTEDARRFAKQNPRLIAEEYIPFKKELALILIRNRNQQFAELPLVETRQENLRCLWVKGPVKHSGQNALIKKLKALLNDINYEGVMAFELFDTKEGALMVNELAPRVHNSGHYSLDALSEDQFSLHIKAVLNMDIKSPLKRAGGFAMLNLLGGQVPGKWLTPAGAVLHWYGKQEGRAGRKLGHLNHLAETPSKALAPLLDFLKKGQKKD